jgi:nucleoside 2-deoxyribosyltransferase
MEACVRAYIAARFEQKAEMKALVPVFAANNIQVRAHWLDETVSSTSQLSDLTPAYCAEQAQVDLDDIDACDIFVLFGDKVPKTIRGGKHVEFGYALAKGKRVVVIGPQENIFQYLPHVVRYRSLEDFLDAEGIQTNEGI